MTTPPTFTFVVEISFDKCLTRTRAKKLLKNIIAHGARVREYNIHSTHEDLENEVLPPPAQRP